jgi:hypothetical protein
MLPHHRHDQTYHSDSKHTIFDHMAAVSAVVQSLQGQSPTVSRHPCAAGLMALAAAAAALFASDIVGGLLRQQPTNNN